MLPPPTRSTLLPARDNSNALLASLILPKMLAVKNPPVPKMMSLVVPSMPVARTRFPPPVAGACPGGYA